jgi:hypothetical protein
LILAILADHVTDLTRHTLDGERRHISDEATLSLMGAEDVISRIQSITYCDYSVQIDHQRQRSVHAAHSDPAIPFALEGNVVLQIFLYGLKIEQVDEQVHIVMDDGSTFTVTAEMKSKAVTDLTARIRKGEIWTLEFQASSATDVIFQYLDDGVEQEMRKTFSAGSYEVAINTRHKDRFAVCLSPANDPFGCIEIKHSFLGEVGASSGRYLFSRGRVWAPPTRTLPAYQSVVVDGLTSAISTTVFDAIRDAQEIDLYIRTDAARTIMSELSRIKAQHKLTTVGGDFSEECDLILISPEQAIPSDWKGQVSTLLFQDQASEGFSELLGRTSIRFEKDAEFRKKALERFWLQASANYHDEPRKAAYGVSWSISTGPEARGRVDLAKLMTFGDEDTRDWTRRVGAQPLSRKAIYETLTQVEGSKSIL